MLHDPKWMSMQLATKEMLQPLLDSIEYMEQNKETIHNRYKGFKDFEVDKVRRLYDWASMTLNTQQQKSAMKNFNLFFTEHDNRRGTNILKTFPELTQFIEECKNK